MPYRKIAEANEPSKKYLSADSSELRSTRTNPAITYRAIDAVSRPMNSRIRFDEIAIMWSPAAASSTSATYSAPRFPSLGTSRQLPTSARKPTRKMSMPAKAEKRSITTIGWRTTGTLRALKANSAVTPRESSRSHCAHDSRKATISEMPPMTPQSRRPRSSATALINTRTAPASSTTSGPMGRKAMFSIYSPPPATFSGIPNSGTS